jgi:FHA domain
MIELIRRAYIMEAALNTVAGRLPLSNSIVKIGSAHDNHLVLQDPKASSLHACIRPEELGYSIIDMGSASGTFVNGQRLEYNSPRLLYPGDAIRIGDTVFTFELSGPALAEAVTPGNTGQGNNAGVSPAVAAPEPAYYKGNTGMQQGYAAGPVSPAGSPAYPGSPAHSTSYPPYVTPSIDPIPANVQGPGMPVQLTPASLLRKEHRRELWTALGILGAALVIGFIVFANLHSPERTLDTFCNALRSGDYQTAYNQLSPGQQSLSQSEADFANSFSHGNRVVSCSYTNVSESGNSAMTTVTLIRDSSFNWRIDGFKSAIQ